MNGLQKISAILGITALVFAVAWLGFVIPRMEKVSANYKAAFSYIARSTFAETIGDSLATHSFIERHHERILHGYDDDIVVVEMTTEFVDAVTERLLFQATNRVSMDRRSRLIEGRKVLLLFPPHLQKRNYVLRRFSYLPEEGVLCTFEGEEEILGLRSYRFSFHAANLDWTANYPNLALPEDATIFARDWGTVWVEPCSGIIVKHEEEWEALISGGKYDGNLVDAGKMWFVPDSIIRQVFIASNERRRLLLHEWVAPGTLALIGGILLLMARPSKGRSPR